MNRHRIKNKIFPKQCMRPGCRDDAVKNSPYCEKHKPQPEKSEAEYEIDRQYGIKL